MGTVGFNLKDIVKRISKSIDRVSITQGILFIAPSLVITLISLALFTLLGGLTAQQLNVFSITIMSAIVLSMVGAGGMHFVIYRIIDEGKSSEDEAAVGRGIRLGIIYSLVFSIVASALLYPYFQNVLNFSLIGFSYFAILLTLFSLTWVFTAAFWATDQYKAPALVFTISYLAVLGLSYGAYRLDPDYIISGYTLGIAVLVLLLVVASVRAFGGQEGAQSLSGNPSTIPKLVSQNYSGMLFQTFYAIAIFLDKIIVWVSEGSVSGNGLMVTSPYTVGAFLGLIPIFGIAALASFANKVKPLAKDRYKGSLLDIQRRIEKYKYFYREGLRTMLVIGFALFILVAIFCFYFIKDPQVLKITVTISLGALLFMVIVYNSVVLPIFRKTSSSTVSMFIVCMVESLAISFVADDIWYASLGFLVGSFIGFLGSHFSTRRLLSEFEYNMFRILSVAHA